MLFGEGKEFEYAKRSLYCLAKVLNIYNRALISRELCLLEKSPSTQLLGPIPSYLADFTMGVRNCGPRSCLCVYNSLEGIPISENILYLPSELLPSAFRSAIVSSKAKMLESGELRRPASLVSS